MSNTIQLITPVFIEMPDLQNAWSLFEAARIERDDLKKAAEAAWKQYQIFCDEDPRWENPASPWEKIQAFYIQRDRLLINAELAEQSYHIAWQKCNQAQIYLLSFSEEE